MTLSVLNRCREPGVVTACWRVLMFLVLSGTCQWTLTVHSSRALLRNIRLSQHKQTNDQPGCCRTTTQGIYETDVLLSNENVLRHSDQMNYFNKKLSNRCVWNWVIVFAYKHRPLAGPADEDKWSRQEQYSSRFINKLIYPCVEWLIHFLISLGC